MLIGVGQLVCLVGVWNDSMLTMLLGRVVFGLGGESLSVSSSALISSWFAGKELALALGTHALPAAPAARVSVEPTDLSAPYSIPSYPPLLPHTPCTLGGLGSIV